MSDQIDNAVAMLVNCTEMGDQEARAFVLREFAGIHRSQAAERLGDLSVSSVDSLHQAAKRKVALPDIEDINRWIPDHPNRQMAIEAVFESGAALRYVQLDDGSILEQTVRFDDPHQIQEEFEIESPSGVSEDACLDEFLTNSLEVYLKHETFESLAQDWDSLFEALTGFSAGGFR